MKDEAAGPALAIFSQGRLLCPSVAKLRSPAASRSRQQLYPRANHARSAPQTPCSKTAKSPAVNGF